MVKTANEEILDAVLRHQIYLLRYSDHVRNRITKILNGTEAELAMRIRDTLRNSQGLTSPVELKRMQALLAALDAIRLGGWEEASKYLLDEMKELAYQEPIIMDEILNTHIPVEISTVLPKANFLRSVALSRPFEGRVLKEWADSMAAEDLRRIHNAVQMGMVAGETAPDIARRVVGSGAVMGADGMTEMTRRQVQAVVRTAVQHVANNARKDFFTANADLITQEQFVATLDSRTTPICRALDGKLFEVGKGPQAPLHFQCRSLRIAAIDGVLLGDRPANPTTEKMLLKEYADKNGLGNIASRADLPKGTKGAYDDWARKRKREMIGPVPATENYQTWLKRQPNEFQDEVLGAERAALYRDGKLTLDKFVDLQTGRQFSLDELRAKYPGAFTAARTAAPRGGAGGGGAGGSQGGAAGLFEPKAGTTTGRVWEVADNLWRQAGSPVDPRSLTVLRGQMREALIAQGINPSTVSVQLSAWQKARMSDAVVIPPPNPVVLPPPGPVPTPMPTLRKIPDGDAATLQFAGVPADAFDLPRFPSYGEIERNQVEYDKLRQYYRINRGDPQSKLIVREGLLRMMAEDVAPATRVTKEKVSALLSKKRAPIPSITAKGIDDEYMTPLWQNTWDALPDWMTNELSDVVPTMGYRDRANYDPNNHSVNFSHQSNIKTMFHELFHALDFKYREINKDSGYRYRQFGDSLKWNSGDKKLDKLAAAAGKEFVERDSRGKGKFNNGDGSYMLGNWLNDYEARMYSGTDKKVSSEYITMAAQEYMTSKQYGDGIFRGRRLQLMKVQPRMVELLDYITGFKE